MNLPSIAAKKKLLKIVVLQLRCQNWSTKFTLVIRARSAIKKTKSKTTELTAQVWRKNILQANPSQTSANKIAFLVLNTLHQSKNVPPRKPISSGHLSPPSGNSLQHPPPTLLVFGQPTSTHLHDICLSIYFCLFTIRYINQSLEVTTMHHRKLGMLKNYTKIIKCKKRNGEVEEVKVQLEPEEKH